jgi:hypothetical protein
MDLAVKWRFFRHLYGGEDPDSEEVYRRHIEARNGHRMEAGVATDEWKTEIDDYVSSATELFKSMSANGFDPEYPIPIDNDGELFGGAHRLACALSLDIRVIPTVIIDDYVWAPPWDYLWFTNNMLKSGNKKILNDWLELNNAIC